MAPKPLVGSCGSVWLVVQKVSVFLTACAVGNSDTQAEQVAEWEMRVFLELCFFSSRESALFAFPAGQLCCRLFWTLLTSRKRS